MVFEALIVTALFLASLSIFLTTKNSLEWILLVTAVYLALYIYFAWITLKAKLFIKADDYCFEYKFGLIKSDKNLIIWDSIKKVKLGPAYIAFYKKSGRKKVVRISWLPYSRVIEIKEKLSLLVESKGIQLEIADFIKYGEKKEKG